jgi:ribonuclease HI
MNSKPKYYVVWKGRKTGIYATWDECARQVQGFPQAEYKAFGSRAEAERALKAGFDQYAGKPASSGRWLFSPQPPISESLCVDAACSGSPGPLEYRCVHTDTGKVIFREGPFHNGTNNVGEFLALVQALAWLQKNKVTKPVYSDSATAIAWVKKKTCNTELAQDQFNAPLFDRIARAEKWLRENEVSTPVLKWDTPAWGEIPADYNRK